MGTFATQARTLSALGSEALRKVRDLHTSSVIVRDLPTTMNLSVELRGLTDNLSVMVKGSARQGIGALVSFFSVKLVSCLLFFTKHDWVICPRVCQSSSSWVICLLAVKLPPFDNCQLKRMFEVKAFKISAHLSVSLKPIQILFTISTKKSGLDKSHFFGKCWQFVNLFYKLSTWQVTRKTSWMEIFIHLPNVPQISRSMLSVTNCG